MQVKEIEALIREIQEKRDNLRRQSLELMSQLRPAKQIEFETEHGIKSGDKLTTKDGNVYYYDHLVGYGSILFVLLHPVKKDGTASKKTKHLLLDDI